MVGSQVSKAMFIAEDNRSMAASSNKSRPQSSMIYFKKAKNSGSVKRYLPEDYFKKVGFKYNQRDANQFT